MYELIELVIRPETAFGTPLKGDTIFGQFFWQIVYDNKLIKKDLNELIDTYQEKPFIIFSSGVYKKENGWLLPRPALPLHFFENIKEEDCFKALSQRKEKKRKKFIKVKEDFLIDVKEENLVEKGVIKIFRRVRNSINRETFTTGEDFAPYEVEEIWYEEGTRVAIFCLYNKEAISEDSIKIGFERIGKVGFGKDASLGLGKFKVEDIKIHPLPEIKDYVYTLSPCLPKESEIELKNSFFNPFIRFGRHGGEFAVSRNPFKTPIIMADEGAVFKLKEKPENPFIGQGIKEISKVCKKAIAQAFSIIFPIRGLSYEGV
ncbi:MAG: hypothetical protein GXO57_01635 [Thermodesulfobacteria bacterium]|nr:hypothetical protein [Thermodesulfobacteriota bacterium]